ncbi:MAG TPA: carboxypeptidase-like regulatory domain-containing protein [Pyrinomonadaceae bacterium]|nr:carboxypeptidase-like regulatory domain-containing protein [Pyrinomonadaceae bacterium]HMP65635.1 carboxypeptidase-like regulatory domain-containing protein [Pyrinomonadaceae bacterium]
MKLALLFVFLSCQAVIVLAQPGCYSVFDPSVTCGRHYLGVEFIFVGKIIEVERGTDAWRDPPRARVAVETLIKGELASEVDAYFIDSDCFMAFWPTPGQKYIFSVGFAKHGDTSRLHVRSWSWGLEAYSPEEVSGFAEEIQSVLRGDRQPPITGRVIQSLGERAYRGMQATPLNMKLGYDPKYARPMAGVVINATGRDGAAFKTTTNEDGEYRFEDLPRGIYEVRPELSDRLFIEGYGDYTRVEDDKKLIDVDDNVCSKRFSFFVEETVIKPARAQPADILTFSEIFSFNPCQ